MEPATITKLPTGSGSAGPGGTAEPASVTVSGDRIVVSRLAVVDHGLATFLASRPEEERAGLVERALKIGLTALQDVGVTVNVDAVRAEFEKIVVRTEQMNERAALALEQMLRTNFADDEGRLPRTLEKFLGDRGALKLFVNDLFDESKRDSAIGRMNTLLGQYFDGDASKLAVLLDPTRMNSPLHQFRVEVTQGFKELNEKIVELQAGSKAKKDERAKSAAKGGDFEDTLEELLGGIARGLGDIMERTGTTQGDAIRSKKGDFVITVNPEQTRGTALRIVLEAKDKYVSGSEMVKELREAKANRNAQIAIVVFSPAHAPAGIAPFDVRVGDVYCVIDPEDPEPAILEAAVRLARLHVLATLTDHEVEVDAEAVRKALESVRLQLSAVQGMKATLTSIGNNAKDVSGKLDQIREAILARLADAEAELNVAK
ncbi:MAG: hypothetical protein RL338_597 [Chloroflexota bacterium]|jgi:hypothetical protein